jgi:hypothetical protein
MVFLIAGQERESMKASPLSFNGLHEFFFTAETI